MILRSLKQRHPETNLLIVYGCPKRINDSKQSKHTLNPGSGEGYVYKMTGSAEAPASDHLPEDRFLQACLAIDSLLSAFTATKKR